MQLGRGVKPHLYQKKKIGDGVVVSYKPGIGYVVVRLRRGL